MTAAAPVTTGAVNVLAALLEARTGQQIAANRSWRIDTSLKPLLIERGIDTIEQLVGQLLDGRDTTVGDRIVDAMLNQESSFFRDAGVIEATVAAVRAIAPGTPRIWSAGCAAGQEPLSLAMTFAEGDGARPEIIASDVSASAIARARIGRFNQFEIQRGLPIRRMMRWFEPDGGDWVASPDLLKLMSFRRHNLVADRSPPGPFDAVYCRNVLFYLTPALRTQVLDKIADVMRPGGLLVLGAGETVIGQTERFVPSRRFRGFYEAIAPSKESRAVYNAS
jgi:chemotaxis protein methyltransferase CheR